MSYDLIENTNTFLDKLDSSLRDLEEAFTPLKGGPSNFYFKRMKEWLGAFFDNAPMKVGDKVQMIRVPEIEKSSGWWHCRDTFKIGALATVVQLDYRDGVYYLTVRWDEEFHRINVGLKNPQEKVVKLEAKQQHVFTLPDSFFVPYNPGYVQWVPWEGTEEQKKGYPRNTVWWDDVVPLLGPGSEVKKKHTYKEKKFLGWIITNPVFDDDE